MTTSPDTALQPGMRVMITMGRWRYCVGRLVSVTETNAVVQLGDGHVTVAPSMLMVMGEL